MQHGQQDIGEDAFPEWRIPPSGLPVPPETLHLLRQGRQPLEASARGRVIQSVVDATVTPHGHLDDNGSVFVLEYVIAGLSLPPPAARGHFAAALSQIIGVHLAECGAEAVDAVAEAILRVYSLDDSFHLKNRHTSVAIMLGLFTAVSVLTTDEVVRYMSARISRKLLRRMRELVETGDATSELLPPTLCAPLQLLRMLRKHGKLDAVTTALLQWADERVGTHDGVSIALLLLLDFKLISHAAFQKAYPARADIRAALRSLFRRQRVFRQVGADHPQHPPASTEMPWILFGPTQLPLGWTLAETYFRSHGADEGGFGGAGPGSTTAFWNDVVLPDVDDGRINHEHALLALELLPMTFASLRAAGDSGALLDKRRTRAVADAVGAFVRGGARPADAWLVRRCRRALENLPCLLFSIGSWPMLAAMRLPFAGSSVFQRADMADVITHKVGSMALGLGYYSVRALFANVAFCFLDPTPFDALTPTDGRQFRPSFVQAMAAATVENPILCVPFIYVMLMSFAFQPNAAGGSCPVFHDASQNAVRTDHDPPTGYQGSIEAFTRYLCDDLDKGPEEVEVCFETLSNLLPFPKAPIDTADAADFFVRFFVFLAEEKDTQKKLVCIEVADKFIDAAVRDGKNFVVRQQAPLLDLSRSVLWTLLGSLHGVQDKMDAGIYRTLVTIGRIFKLLCLAPTVNSEFDVHDEVAIFLDQFAACVKVASHESKEKKRSARFESTLRKTVMLLLTLCMADNSLAHLSYVCIDVIGESLTGSVCKRLCRRVHDTGRALGEIKASTQTPSEDTSVERTMAWFLHRCIEHACGNYARVALQDQQLLVKDLLEIFVESLEHIFLSTPFLTSTVEPIVAFFEGVVETKDQPALGAARSEIFVDQLFADIMRHLPQELPHIVYRMASVAMTALAGGESGSRQRVILFLNDVWQANLDVFAEFVAVVPEMSVRASTLASSTILSSRASREQKIHALKCLSIITPVAVNLHNKSSLSASPFWKNVSELHDSVRENRDPVWTDGVISMEFVKILNTGIEAGAALGFNELPFGVAVDGA